MENFTLLVQKSKTILIAGHMTPDIDAYASTILMGKLIQENYSEKTVHMVIDSKNKMNLISHLEGYEEIELGSILEKLKNYKPDLLILVDGSDVSRFFTDIEEFEKIRGGTKVAIFDHHTPVDENVDYYLSEKRWSCVDVIYNRLVKLEGFKPFKGWEEVYLTGLISDSSRFYYSMQYYRDTFDTVSNLLDKGYSIRDVSDSITGFTRDELKVFNLFIQKVKYNGNYAFAYITQEEFETELKGIDVNIYKRARRYYIDNILVKVYDIDFCYTLAPDETVDDDTVYTLSFRSKPNTYDCVKLVQNFKGGGHITGAGGTIVANNMEDAIKQVEESISNTIEEAGL